MNFMEATLALKDGFAIRRKAWRDLTHLKVEVKIYNTGLEESFIQVYRQEIVPFDYDTSIVFSNDWIVIGTNENELIEFAVAVEMLKHKRKVKLKEWPRSTFLELSPDGNDIYMRRMCEFNYVPCFEDFADNDWEILEDS